MTEESLADLQFGIRLATAAQLMQGMLCAGEKASQPMIESAVKWADSLIEQCGHDS